MALFDAKTVSALDDTIPLNAVIESAENIQGFTEYVINVTRGYNSQQKHSAASWTIRRRYRDFVALNGKLIERAASNFDLSLPPKKMFGNLNREFVAKRTQDLQAYLNRILSIPYVALSKDVKSFLDPKNYTQDFTDAALQMSMCTRGMHDVVVEKPLPFIGWRYRKTYFLANSPDRSSKRGRNLIAWAFYGPDFCLDYADAQLVLDFLSKINHSLIRTPQRALCTENGAVIVNGAFEAGGTLRDVLCNAKPEKPFIQKYLSPREPNCFDVRQLQLLGRKILEASKLLMDKCIPCGHLHCGNVIVTKDDTVQLLDVENVILGLPPLYRDFMVRCKAVKTFEDVVVYSFGHTFYEIVIGSPLNAPFISPEVLSSDFPAPFARVLQSILSQESTRNGLPSLQDLLSLEVFLPTWYQSISTNCQDIDFKVPSKIKQLFGKCQERFLQRLHQDQAEYRRAVSMKRVETYVNSEEQKRSRRRAVRVATKETINYSAAAISTNRLDEDDSRPPAPPPPPPPPPPPMPPMPPNEAQGGRPSAVVAGTTTAANNKIITTSSSPAAANAAASRADSTSTATDTSSILSATDGDRSALLASIRNFSSSRLKKAVTVDKSGPKF